MCLLGHIMTDVEAIEQRQAESNRQRQKTNEQIGREYKTLKRVYHERESKQGTRNDLTSVRTRTEVPPSTQAASAIGVAKNTANQAAAVVNAVDDLKAAGKEREAEQLRSTLNGKSVRAAYEKAKEDGHLPPAAPREAPVETREPSMEAK